MQALKIKRKLPSLDDAEVMHLLQQFKYARPFAVTCAHPWTSNLSTDGQYLSKAEVSKALTSNEFTYDQVREALKSTSDTSGRVDVEELAELYAKLKEGTGLLAQSKAGKVKLGGSTASSSHTVNDDERVEFTRHINSVSGAW
jgi:plastin-1